MHAWASGRQTGPGAAPPARLPSRAARRPRLCTLLRRASSLSLRARTWWRRIVIPQVLLALPQRLHLVPRRALERSHRRSVLRHAGSTGEAAAAAATLSLSAAPPLRNFAPWSARARSVVHILSVVIEPGPRVRRLRDHLSFIWHHSGSCMCVPVVTVSSEASARCARASIRRLSLVSLRSPIASPTHTAAGRWTEAGDREARRRDWQAAPAPGRLLTRSLVLLSSKHASTRVCPPAEPPPPPGPPPLCSAPSRAAPSRFDLSRSAAVASSLAAPSIGGSAAGGGGGDVSGG